MPQQFTHKYHGGSTPATVRSNNPAPSSPRPETVQQVNTLQKSACVQSAVKAVEWQKASPSGKLASHRHILGSRNNVGGSSQSSPNTHTSAPASDPGRAEKVKAVEREIAKSEMTAKSKGKEREKGSNKNHDEKMFDVDKVLAVPQAMSAAANPRLGLVGRLTAIGEVKDKGMRGDIGQLAMNEVKESNSKEPKAANRISADEVQTVLETPKLLKPYISHCKRTIATNGGVNPQAVNLANAALSTSTTTDTTTSTAPTHAPNSNNNSDASSNAHSTNTASSNNNSAPTSNNNND